MRLVLITGAGGGMGSELCKYLIEQGYEVLGIDHNKIRLKNLTIELNSQHFYPLEADLKEENLIEKIESILLETKSFFYGLINLAAISKGDSIEQLSDSDWQESFSVNVTAPMKLCRFAATKMVQGGSIVNVSSPVGLIGARKASYAASKAALLGLTMSLARNLGTKNIRVNMVLPGTTITYMTHDWPEEKRQAIAQESFLKRLCTPLEFAKAVNFLLSEDSSYMTGAIFDLTAGAMVGH